MIHCLHEAMSFSNHIEDYAFIHELEIPSGSNGQIARVTILGREENGSQCRGQRPFHAQYNPMRWSGVLEKSMATVKMAGDPL